MKRVQVEMYAGLRPHRSERGIPKRPPNPKPTRKRPIFQINPELTMAER